MHHKDIELRRRSWGKSVLLFITESCPVGCSHCSVSSLPNSPRIEDFELFESIVNELCNWAEIEVVGITGGEPFVERRGLAMATQKLSNSGKSIVLYTSGYWAQPAIQPWITEVLSHVKTVYLSTDAFHEAFVSANTIIRAIQIIKEAGCWLVLQINDQPFELSKAHELLRQTLGPEWESFGEISRIPLLPYGRSSTTPASKKMEFGEFGRCQLLSSPVIRFDGKITACCNERVIAGDDSVMINSQFSLGSTLKESTERLHSKHIFRTIEAIGFSGIRPFLPDELVMDKRFVNICEACSFLRQSCNSSVFLRQKLSRLSIFCEPNNKR